MYRGGVGLEFAYTPLGTPQPLTCVYVSAGVSAPSGRGLFGGYPSSINANVVLRKSNILELFKKGIIPTSMDEINSATTEILQAKANIQMMSGDVAVTMEAGGGGYGDPLKRDPEMVCRDVVNGLVSLDVTRRVHGVVFNNARTTVDRNKTARLREEILAKRSERKPIKHKDIINKLKAQGIEYKDLKTTQIVSDFLDVRVPESKSSSPVIFCSSCGTPICFTSENLREYMSRSQPIPIDFLSPVNRFCADPTFSMIEYSCPDCGTLLSVDIVRKEELETVRPEFLLTEK
jgi:N-methylhydantoinase B